MTTLAENIVNVENIINIENTEDTERTERDEREERTIFCPYCGAEVDKRRYDCPNCGVVIRIPPRKRIKSERDVFAAIESENMNGKYNIYLLQDKSLFCDCFSFLFQRGLDVEGNQIVCKHIKKTLNAFPRIIEETSNKKEPITEWQRVLLKKLNITPHPNLTREQAYWIVYELLTKMDMEYKDFIRLIKRNPNYELLPLFSYGLELEGLVKNRVTFYEKMKDLGFKVKLTGYSHEMENELWKVGDDGSIRRNMSFNERQQYESIELTTPKLCSAEGFKKVKKVLDIWNEIGSTINNSCGFHVHVNAYSFNERDIARLILTWMRIEPVIYFLVSPSRRNNYYAKMLRKELSSTIARLILGFVTSDDRYYAINRVAYHKYKTIEFRIHQGTTSFEKVKNWTIFCLKLMEKVKKGLKWCHFSEEPTIEEVLDKLGIVENAAPIIQEARRYFIERYNHFRTESETHDLPPMDIESLKREIKFAIKQSYANSHHLVTEPASNYINTHYIYLAKLYPRNFYSYETILQGRKGNKFYFTSSNGRTKHVVTFNEEEKTLSCNCKGFKENLKCSHAICVAKFLYVEEKIKNLRDHFENLDF
jgi:hypothetical protein